MCRPVRRTLPTKDNARCAASRALERPVYLPRAPFREVLGRGGARTPLSATSQNHVLGDNAGPGGFLTSSEEPFSTRNRPALWMAPSASLEMSWGQESAQLGGWVTVGKVSCLYPSCK